MQSQRERLMQDTSSIQFIQEDAESIFNNDYSFSSTPVMNRSQMFGKRKSDEKDVDDDGDSDEDCSIQSNPMVPMPPRKKTKGRVKIKMEYIENKLRRYTTFSKRKTGIMKKVSLKLYLHGSIFMNID